MTIFLIILFIVECLGFCYLYVQIQDIFKDIDTLYKDYSNYIEQSIKFGTTQNKDNKKGSVLK